MSRVGRKLIPVPKDVKVHVSAEAVEVEGPKGKLRQAIPPGVRFEERDGTLLALPIRENDTSLRKFHGLARSLVANAVHGVAQGFKKELDIVGIGYRAEKTDRQVVFALGYSHPIKLDIPAGIDIAVEKQTHITVSGIDRQRVGQMAANIRALRKPDPYKQKGIRYTGEVLKKKVGKTGA
jgi:large subunit ribosomal protein L6